MFGTPEFQALAKLDRNGDLAVKVTGFCDYGERTASYSAEVALDEKDVSKIRSILKKAIDAAEVEISVRTGETDKEGKLVVDADGKPLREIKNISLGQQVFNDAAESLVVATKKGETV